MNPIDGEGTEEFILFDNSTAVSGLKVHGLKVIYEGQEQKSGRVKNFTQIRAAELAANIFNAVDEWDLAMKDNPVVQANKANLASIKKRGDTVANGLFEIW